MKLAKKLDLIDSLKTIGVATEYFPGYYNPRMDLHGVDVVLLSLIQSGSGIHYLAKERFVENGRSLAVTHYGECHSIVSESDMDILNIYFNLKHFETPLVGGELQPFLSAFLPDAYSRREPDRICRIELDSAGEIERCAFLLHDELSRRAPGYLLAAQNYFQLFLIACCRQVRQSGVTILPEQDSAAPRIEKLLLKLKEHPEHRWTLTEMAQYCGFQKNYFCRKFKEQKGVSPFASLEKLRLQKALYLLQHTRSKLDSVADDCGFADATTLCRHFRREFGRTPLQFRNGQE